MSRLGALLLGLAVAGCADGLPGPFWTDEPTATPVAGAAPIRRATGEDAVWPHLSSVPPRPTEFSSPMERQALLDRLQGDHQEGLRLLEEATP